MLKIHNSLAREKQEFVPIEPGKVRMYVCGVTVYDYCHLGHARFLIAFDIVRRWLKALGYQVTYVRNITDIEDKIIKRAQENREPVESLTARFIQAMNEDAAALGCEPADFEPRATEHVPGMLEMIAQLEARGLAYAAASGDVNYAVRKFPGLRQALRQIARRTARRASGSRSISRSRIRSISCCGRRRKPGEPSWESPWGRGGRAGTSSARSCRARSSGTTSTSTAAARTCSFRTTRTKSRSRRARTAARSSTTGCTTGSSGCKKGNDEKMSKSLGNFFTVREVLAHYDPEVVRFFIVRAHYRSPLNYSDQHLDDARQALTRLYTALKGCRRSAGEIDWNDASCAALSRCDERRFQHARSRGRAVRAGERAQPVARRKRRADC